MNNALYSLAFTLLLFSTGDSLQAQRDRITLSVDPARTVSLSGNLRPEMLRRNDAGRVEEGFPLPAMTLFLKPSGAEQADLRQLLEEQRNPASPAYHHWLTPEQFAERFGVSPNDVAVVTHWLRSQGFTVPKVAISRRWVAFSGTERQVESAFHAEIHRYRSGGKNYFANAEEPSIPQALADVVLGIEGLDDFSPDTAKPEMTSITGFHTLAPDDLATIYNITSLYRSGIDGTGQTIAVMGTTQFNASALADVAIFRSTFGLPPNIPQVVLDTDFPDPGLNPNSINEAHLDIEWAGAIARNARIIFVYSGTFLHAVLYTVDNNLAPVITMSANAGCEAVNTPANMSFYQAVAQQANAEGITWVNSGSDAGPASCDANGTQAVSGLGLRFPASIPEVTAVGGTEFNEQGASYWGTSNTANSASALSYIPEMVWNDALALGALWAGGGGRSIYFPKPIWQTGPGVPNDNARDLPDVALAASFSHDGYDVVRNGVMITTGGTSASAPVFAGIIALLNQYLVSNGLQSQPGVGNVNPMLYRLAAGTTGVFHDITNGSNVVPCVSGTPDCPNGSIGFKAGPGFDLASGLGSVDTARFLDTWLTKAALPAPSILPGGVVPVDSSSTTIQPGEWVSIYGTNLASATVVSDGSFPTSLGGTNVTIDGKPAYLSFVSPGQINLQAPNDAMSGTVAVTVATFGGNATATVALSQFAPSFLLLDGSHVAGIIVRFDGSGVYGGGAYDIIGPTGTSLGYATVAAKPGDTLELFGTGFGPTDPAVQAGEVFSGSAPTTSAVTVFVNGISVPPSFAGLSGASLDQINLTVPSGLGTGDVSLRATVGGAQTPLGILLSLQ